MSNDLVDLTSNPQWVVGFPDAMSGAGGNSLATAIHELFVNTLGSASLTDIKHDMLPIFKTAGLQISEDFPSGFVDFPSSLHNIYFVPFGQATAAAFGTLHANLYHLLPFGN